MKTVKQILTALLTLVMLAGILSGCGTTDAVLEEFESFLNVDMVTPNENYEEMKELFAQWETIQEEALFIENVDKILANVKESKQIVSQIELTSEEVKAIRDLYAGMLDEYIDAFESFKEGIQTQNEELINTCSTKIDSALEILNEYNAALDALAAEKGVTIEYEG